MSKEHSQKKHEELIYPPIYLSHDPAPFKIIGLVGVQFFVKFSMLLICSIFIAKEAGANFNDTLNFISIGLIAAVISSLLISCNWIIGANRFIPSQTSVVFFAISLLAAKAGGLELVFGVAIIGGLSQILSTFLFNKRIKLWDFHFSGFLLLLIGIWLGLIGVSEIFSPHHLGQVFINVKLLDSYFSLKSSWIGFVSLAIMIILQLRGSGRIYCILVGILVGWVLAAIFNQIIYDKIMYVNNYPWFWIPSFSHKIAFNLSSKFVPMAIIIGIIASFEMFAIISALQLSEEKNLETPNLSNISKGNMAAGVGLVISGLLGGAPQSPTPGSVGDFLSTGVLSKKIVFIYALLVLLIAFSPKIICILLTIPASVNGAVLIFMSSVIIMRSFIILDFNSDKNYRLLALGLALMLSISTLMIHQFVKISYTPFVTNIIFFSGIFFYLGLTIIFRLRN